MSSSDPPAAPPRSRRSSATSASSSSAPSPPPTRPPAPPAGYYGRTGAGHPVSPSRRLSAALPVSSSPLSLSSASSRRRQDSISSSVSNTTDATSLDESGEECMGPDVAPDKPEPATASGSLSSSSSNSSSFGTATATGGSLTPSRRLAGPSSLSTQDLLPQAAATPASPLNTPHAVSVSSPPPPSFPIPIASSIPPSSVRLSTTPLFPSPLAQASGPEEDPSRGDDGDSEGDEDDDGDEEAWGDKARERRMSSLRAGAPFGELEFSPPGGTIALPDPASSPNELTVTPRPANRSRHRQTPDARDSSPEHDPTRTARAGRVRTSLGRASGLSSVFLASSGDESPVSKRRSRDLSGLSGLGVDIKGATTTPTRNSVMSASFSGTAGSPPSPSSSLSVSPSSLSRRSSISLVSPSRHLAPSSPTSNRMGRGSISGALPGMPLPFPAAPVPSESIKLQKVPESVRTAVEFRQPNSLTAAYLSETMSLPGGFKPSTSPTEYRLPATPLATRAPSPASPPSSRSSQQHSPVASRPASRMPSRQSSREKLSALVASPLERNPPSASSSASSAFSPLFNVPTAPPASRTRDRSRSINVPPMGTPLGAHATDPFPLPSPTSPPAARARGSPPIFNLEPFARAPAAASSPGTGPTPRAAIASVAPLTGSAAGASTSATAAFGVGSLGSGATGPAPGPGVPAGRGRLNAHRMSIAPTGMVGAHDSTDEYAQIILSTRNAKVRKWKTSGGPSVSTLEAGTAGTGKTWTNLGEAREGATGAGAADDEQPGDERELGRPATLEVRPETREIEWVDWLDEYRKMKEAKLKADQRSGAVEEDDEEDDDDDKTREVTTHGAVDKDAVKETKPLTPSPPRRTELAEPALTAAQKGKAKATTTRFNPFEATSAPPTSAVSTNAFLTPSIPGQHHDYFPLTGHGAGTSRSSSFQPMATASPMTIGDPFDFAPLGMSSSRTGSTGSQVGSPSARRKRNFAKLGNKIDAWWSAVRTSFAGAEEDKTRHRRTSHNHALSPMPTIEPLPSRTSSQLLRPNSPGTPTLRNIASTSDLLRPSLATSVPTFKAGVPGGALAPAARVDSQHRGKAGSDPRAVSSGEESDGATTSRIRRNPHLSLNLGPTMNNMLPVRLSPLSSPSIPSSAPAEEMEGAPSSPPKASPVREAETSLPVPVPVLPFSPDESRLTPDHSPMWDRTPGLVTSQMQLGARERQSSTLSQTRPKVSKEGKSSSFSMQTVRQQIRQRLASAKENCDKELRRIVAGITAYVETELHRDISTPMPFGFGSGAGPGNRFGELSVDDGSPQGYASTVENEDSGSEAVANADDEPMEELAFTDSDGASTSIPPSRLKTMTSGTPHAGRRRSAPRSESPRRASLQVRQRRLTSAPRDSSQVGERRPRSAGGRGGRSNESSRSNSQSRSHSPLPPGRRHVSGSRSPGLSALGVFPQASATDLAQSALIVLLQEIIMVATEVLDTPISKLTSRSGMCGEYIQRVQQIGEAWTENSELPCRGWYVQLLLAVAGLSRVVEWWEAEKGFWSFDDPGEGDGEPILFVAKPTADASPEVRARGESFSSIPSLPALQPPANPRWSPLGIDLGDRMEVLSEPEGRSREPTQALQEVDTQQRADDLRQAVETIRSQTLLVELSLDGQLFQYLSSAWRDLVGMEPEECLDMPIADFLYPGDASVFAEATRQLEADDSHTVEVSFRLRVAWASDTSQDEQVPEDFYEAMEGKGMLMLDGLTGSASHTMWVIRPTPYTEAAVDANRSLSRYGFDTLRWRSSSDPTTFLAPSRLNLEPILCRICERPTPAWFFEKHSETCNEVHHLESDISECNDRLKDLLGAIDELVEGLRGADGADTPVEYQGIPLTVSPAATPPTYLEGLRPPLAPRSSPSQSHQVRRNQQRVFDHVREIIQIAMSISTPSVTDETGEIPIQEQRLLSPNSENSLAAVMRWQRPYAEEPALSRLVVDTEEQIRYKLNSVNRLRNTILYAEKVRQEWEAKAQEALAAIQPIEESSRQPSPLPFDSPQLQPLPQEDSPRNIDALDLPRPTQALRRQVSQPMTLLSPTAGTHDESALSLSTSPGAGVLLSPRIPAAVPSSRTKVSSIKDFKVIKPISKGAFGSVYLAKKITTGDYYAIKVLKKSDMVAKNQVTNVKAERMILMTQTESDFVVKLYYTFQSKDYLYLVMEYLNGGDCAALVKNLGGLPEDWARRYIAEVVVGLEHLHQHGIVHRDLKPDNLLIDSKGHLKLTDFGLSRIGLLGRQTQLPSLRNQRRPSTINRTGSGGLSNRSSPLMTPAFAPHSSQTGYFGNVPITDSFSLDTPSESSGSSAPPSAHAHAKQVAVRSPSTSASRPIGVVGPPGAATETPDKHFVGTPDYLAPESILGVGMDACVDWWALGVICYEFLYGIPPFHDETPEKVFENILSRRIEWHEDVVEISPEARSFIDRLLCPDTSRRLGTKGSAEVKAHPFLADVDWDNLLKQPVDFVPKVADPESTDYFDPRGATAGEFKEDEGIENAVVSGDPAVSSDPAIAQMQALPTPANENGACRAPRERADTAPVEHDDFGTFNFRNLTVLKQANDDVVRKLKDEQLIPTAPPIATQKGIAKSRGGSIDLRQGGPSSPSSVSNSSSSSVAHRTTAASSLFGGGGHSRQQSEQPVVERFRKRQPSLSTPGHHALHQRRNSLPSRLRKVSVSDASPADGGRPALPVHWAPSQTSTTAQRRTSVQHVHSSSTLSSSASAFEPLPPLQIPESSMQCDSQAYSAPPMPAPIDTSCRTTSSPASACPVSSSRLSTIDCLVAGRNPIVTKVLETMLQRLGCRVVVVPNGAEAILAAGGIPFDVLFLDLAMPVVDGEKAARMIKSTVNPSTNAPIVAVCSQPAAIDDATGTLFTATLPKPIMKADLLAVLSHLGFKLEVKASEERRGSADSERPASPGPATQDQRRPSA
ncbi:hypothetical protein JCM3770_004663 [Rhodotorula araucariae]